MVIVFLLGSLANPILANEEGARVPSEQKSGIVKGLADCVNKGLGVTGIKEISALFWKKARGQESCNVSTSSIAQPGSYSLMPPRNAEPNKGTLRNLLRETCETKNK